MLVPYALLAVVALILGGWFVRWRMMWGPQLRILKHGIVGEATVLDRNELKTTSSGGGSTRRRIQYLGSLVLEVRREGQAAYRAPCQQWFESTSWSFVAEGARVPVRIDREDPQRVFVDSEAKLRELQDAQDTDRERHAKRQAELLGGDK